jgi:hypothetical protein
LSDGEFLMLLIRDAAVSDVPLLLTFFRELAEYDLASIQAGRVLESS